MPLAIRLREYIAACFTGLWIQSYEHEDAQAEIARLCREESWRLAVWDIDQGLRIIGHEAQPLDTGSSDPLAAIRALNALGTADSSALLVLVNFHRFLNSAEVVQALAHQIAAGKQNRTFILVLIANRPDSHRAGETIRRPGTRSPGSRATCRNRSRHRHAR